ncbi:actin-binding LIM protein 2 isoform X4 [Drosophila willistoni]|uniref:actin-binding LIM protein 2 isoform X4 n=1 Tax=Drosophila willistoni TaxID=7260 RepID=UPI000C26CF34|nr:actin-binding LIM protein 2 isoform X4 [Drosophila willistoni]
MYMQRIVNYIIITIDLGLVLDKTGQGKQKIYCAKCTKKCSGEVLRVADNHFHKACFQCCQCKKSLATGGFFTKDSAYYCIPDYQRLYGTKCATCQQYVEGEVVSTMGKTYHQKCFTCSKCSQPFKSGSKVTNTGKEVLCEQCVSGVPPTAASPSRQAAVTSPAPPAESPTRATAHQQLTSGVISHKAHLKEHYDPNDCAGCGELLKEGQALVALDRQWHVSCFRCKACQAVLNGEYMGKDGVPYCEKCYQKSFGVKCAYCNRFISGKVLQAGDNHHFHPTCARCTKCGDPFGDGEEMYLQGSAIWHPRCGPGPSESGIILNGGNTSVAGGASNGNFTDTECDRMSSSAMSDMYIRSRTPSFNGSLYSPSRKHYRTVSPGLILREYGRPIGEDISRIYTYSYLTDAPHYLRKPIDPYDKTALSPHFHRPSSYATTASNAGSVAGSRPPSRPHSRTRSAMKVLVDAIRSETPRPKSPGMNNEEPIELSHYPAAKKPPPGEQPKIERDDFPAPPYPYTDPERRRRYSESYHGVPVSDDDDENNGDQANGKVKNGDEQIRLKREAEQLEKLNSGIGSAIAKDLKEHAKYRKWKQNNLDPRNASRTPSASKEPLYKLRYESPIGASPSRHLDHQKPFYEDEMFDRSTSYRGSLGKSLGNAPSYNGGLGDKTHSTDLSCGKSEASVDSITDGDRRALMGNGTDLHASSTYSGALSYHYPQAGLIRRSLPNMAHSMLVHEPAKIYPYHLLLITNYRLPSDVDRCNLERHLSDIEFEHILQCGRSEFYRLPQWRRNELKRRMKLF